MPNAFDFSASPFDTLDADERGIVRAAVDIAYFADAETVLDDGAAPDGLFVLIKGHVSQFDGDEIVATYGPGDCFDGRSLVAGRAIGRFVAAEEVVAYRLATTAVNELISRNAAFGALLFSDLSNKLGALADRHHQREMRALTMARVDEAFLRPAHEVDGGTPIVEAARLMHARRSSSVLVRDGGRLGVFTNTGLQRAVATATASRPLADTPVRDFSTFSLVTIRPDAPLFDALALMIQHQVHRLVVTGGEAPAGNGTKIGAGTGAGTGTGAGAGAPVIGVLEQLDLLSFLSNHSYLITVQIAQADDLAALREPARRITQFVSVLHRGGVRVAQIGRLVQAINAKLFERAWQLIAPPELVAASCLFVMGSEGRGEQLLKTDQDNGLVVADDAPVADDVVADACERFSRALGEFGYPPCPGGIMVRNPAWRLRRAAFIQVVRRWLLTPDAEGLMALAIFLDAHPVAGDPALLAEVRASVDALVREDDALLGRMAAAIDMFPSETGGWWHRLLAIGDSHRQAERHALDPKKAGIFPIVHGVRCLALREHIAATATVERIDALVAAGRLPREMAVELTGSLHFLMELRLKAGLAELDVERPVSGDVATDRLSSLERDLLKDALAAVKRFKTLVRHQFHLSEA